MRRGARSPGRELDALVFGDKGKQAQRMMVGSLELGELPLSPLPPCASEFCSSDCQMSFVLGHNDQVPEEPTLGHSQGCMQVYAIVEAWMGVLVHLSGGSRRSSGG